MKAIDQGDVAVPHLGSQPHVSLPIREATDGERANLRGVSFGQRLRRFLVAGKRQYQKGHVGSPIVSEDPDDP